MNDLTTSAGLADGLATAGSWAELGRRVGIPATTLKSRAKRLGVNFQTSGAFDESLTYHEEMAEFLANSGFSGYRVHGAMLRFCAELGVSREVMFEVASHAAELARREYDLFTRDLDALWGRYLGAGWSQ